MDESIDRDDLYLEREEVDALCLLACLLAQVLLYFLAADACT